MKWLIEKSRFLAFISVYGLLVCAVTAFALGVYKTYKTSIKLLQKPLAEENELNTLYYGGARGF
jgi:uncharacterized membrane protein YqhA